MTIWIHFKWSRFYGVLHASLFVVIRFSEMLYLNGFLLLKFCEWLLNNSITYYLRHTDSCFIIIIIKNNRSFHSKVSTRSQIKEKQNNYVVSAFDLSNIILEHINMLCNNNAVFLLGYIHTAMALETKRSSNYLYWNI